MQESKERLALQVASGEVAASSLEAERAALKQQVSDYGV